MQNVPVNHAPLQQPPHGTNFIYSEAPSVRQHQPQTKFIYRSQPPHENRFHPSMVAGPKAHGHKSVSNFDKSHFRASQPLPLIDNTDLPTSSFFHAKRYQNQNNEQPNRSALKSSKPANYRSVTASTFIETDNSEEWSPFTQSLVYPKHYLNSENRQYQQQERISFYPDTNPEYFQPHHNYDTPETRTSTVFTPPLKRPPYNFISTAESKYQSYVAPPTFRAQTTESSPTSPSAQLNEDLPPSHKRVPYIRRRKYRTKKPISPKQPDSADDVKPVVEYPNESSPTKQIYVRNVQRSTETPVSSTHRTENESASIFITPVTPTNTDAAAVLDGNSEPETVTAATETAAVTTKRKHNRIFRRKLVQNIGVSGLMGESCESTCLSNIVSRDYDPVCGSDDKSYANLGRLRCTKICGDHRKYTNQSLV